MNWESPSFREGSSQDITDRIGFLHRYMALSTLIWLGVHAGVKPTTAASLETALLWGLFGLLGLICVTALAPVRRRFHNLFEAVHRYGGWLATLVLLSYFVATFSAQLEGLSGWLALPEFYLLLAILGMLIAPWWGVSKAYPQLVHVGPHVIGLELPGQPSFGTYSRITLSNGCFHPFGDSMIDFQDRDSRVLYITPAGDRTSELVDAANQGAFRQMECTLRKDRFKGFMYHHSVYDHILILVTGGGIAPVIPCLMLNDHTQIDVLWLGKDQPKEFTQPLLDQLGAAIANKSIRLHVLNTHDPDLIALNDQHYTALALKACAHYQPQAVFVMSNQPFTIDLMHALSMEGYKAYGATFDS